MTEYDQLTRDLAHKAADDAQDAIMRVIVLSGDQQQRAMIINYAAGAIMRLTVAVISKATHRPPAVVADVIWARLRPHIIAGAERTLDEASGDESRP